MYLPDTNGISELRKHKPHPAVTEWINAVSEDDLCISAAIIGEIHAGIKITRRRDAAKAQETEHWPGIVEQSYGALDVAIVNPFDAPR